jgi:methylenetetrahydrofolate dehydrogenase (NADP+)/methenyltetrahydrofolate cyclohydrolase
MIILDGKTTSQKILDKIKIDLERFSKKPRLDIILVGDDPASLQYDEMKQEKAIEIGIESKIHHLPQDSSTFDVVSLVEKLNNDDKVTAFMVQLPLPEQIQTSEVLNTIDLETSKQNVDNIRSNIDLLENIGNYIKIELKGDTNEYCPD